MSVPGTTIEDMTTTPSRIRSLLATGLVAALGALGATAAEAAPRPDVIPLPAGFSPEGVATGTGNSVYVGSLRDGDIWRGDLRTGEGRVLVDAPEGRTAVGIKIDKARKLIVVSGGGTGQAFFYSSRTGDEIAAVTLTTQSDTFINDVALTREGAWFTDSRQPVLYFVPFERDGSIGSVQVLELSGPAADVSGDFNLNGIAASPDGSTLIVAHSARAELIAVDPESWESETIDLGGASVPNADGLLLDGRRLWVVQNFLNQVSEVRLSPDYTSGEVVSVRTDEDLRIPTTIARQGNRLIAVNARFDLGIPGPVDAEYELVVLSR